MAGEPTLQALIREALDSRLLDVHTALPGKVRNYDRATHTAEVEPMIQRATPRADGSTLDEKIPPIQNVPVAWPRGGSFYLEFPLASGDEGMLLFSEAAMGMFRETGQLSRPGDLRRHSLSYCAFLPFQISNYDDGDSAGTDAGLIHVPNESHVTVRSKGDSDDFVVLVGKLKTALQDAASSGSGGAVPNDGGKAAFLAFGKAVGAFTVGDIGSDKLKAGSST